MRKILSIALAAVGASALLVTGASAQGQQAATSSVTLTGVGFSSLGPVGTNPPGIETVILANYGESAKSLRGYRVTDSASNTVYLCAEGVTRCTSTTADNDRAADETAWASAGNTGTAPVISNAADNDAWLTLDPLKQTVVNVETRYGRAWMNNGGDTVYLRNSTGRILTKFVFTVSNPPV
jgi:hypothetical protein